MATKERGACRSASFFEIGAIELTTEVIQACILFISERCLREYDISYKYLRSQEKNGVRAKI